ncbi:hypothetical protein EE612_020824 [Oryza sativa]|nr:hypothetical protein EE612_020824 [Oryza sativa]
MSSLIIFWKLELKLLLIDFMCSMAKSTSPTSIRHFNKITCEFTLSTLDGIQDKTLSAPLNIPCLQSARINTVNTELATSVSCTTHLVKISTACSYFFSWHSILMTEVYVVTSGDTPFWNMRSNSCWACSLSLISANFVMSIL